jgi:hypothetical protein
MEDDKSLAAGGLGTPGPASPAVANDPLAPGEQRVAAQEVCGSALLAGHCRGRELCWLVAGGTPHTRPTGGPLNSTGVTCRPRPRWQSWAAMPIAAMPSSSSMRRPRASWAGIPTKAACGLASTDTRSPSCWPTASWCGWSCANAMHHRVGVAHATLFPPRADRRRHTLPAVHREVARWLRHQAVQWWVTTDRFIELCSQRF